jgi:hypothetical protein
LECGGLTPLLNAQEIRVTGLMANASCEELSVQGTEQGFVPAGTTKKFCLHHSEALMRGSQAIHRKLVVLRQRSANRAPDFEKR